MDHVSYSNAVEEIKSRCNIVDVISAVVPLKRSGARFKGCCPFHKEKTPSFFVSEQTQFYHCFGCGESGDVLNFVMKYYNIGFPDAVEKLAAQYGITIDKGPADPNAQKKDVLYDANKKAARFFFGELTRHANPGYTYFKGRGLSDETIRKFGLGYADDEWQTLTDAMKGQGVAADVLTELGLSSTAKDGRLYDRFRGRAVFPIIDTKSKVIGFGARIIGQGEPKYLNSSESSVFQKKNNLYSLNLTRSEIQKEGFAILVEGYMDVIGLYQGGVKNVTASLGTALTEQQARLLKRYTDKVVLCYDSDNAGIKAAFTGIDVLRGAGVDVRVMQVDDGKDPDEYMKRHSRDEFIDLALNKSRTDIDYKIFIISTRYDMDDTKQRVKFLEAAADVLRALPPVEQDVYISKVAADYHFSEGALRRQVEEGGKSGAPVVERVRDPESSGDAPAPNAAELLDPAMLQIEKNIIRLLLLDPSYLQQLAGHPDAIVSPQGVRIRDALQKLAASGEEADISVLRDSLGDAEANYLDEILLEIPVGEKDGDAFADCLRQLDIRRAKRRQKEIMDILALDDGTIDHKQLDGLMKEYTTLERIQKR